MTDAAAIKAAVAAAQTARVDMNLEVGADTESVNVEAAAPLVQSTTSDVAQNIACCTAWTDSLCTAHS